MLIVPKKTFEYRELDSSPRIFIDLEGTLSDFYRYFAQINYYDMRSKGISISEISPEVYRKRSIIRKYMHKRMSNQKLDYWAKVPKTRCADALWRSLKPFKPYIFTGSIEGDLTMEMGKLKWCRKRTHLGFKNADLDRVLVNKDRFEYAKNGICPNILIDDDSENCAMWERAGGISYYYMDHAFVVDKIIDDVKSDLIKYSNIEFLLKWDESLSRYVY
ncbi:MAG: hypothetical protein WC358_02000 [Ignavibacteria bacterium]|jgi:hypothetical protein